MHSFSKNFVFYKHFQPTHVVLVFHDIDQKNKILWKLGGRHPRICRYLQDNGYCKFSKYCFFEHDFVKNNVQEIKDITVKLKGIEELIAEKSKQKKVMWLGVGEIPL